MTEEQRPSYTHREHLSTGESWTLLQTLSQFPLLEAVWPWAGQIFWPLLAIVRMRWVFLLSFCDLDDICNRSAQAPSIIILAWAGRSWYIHNPFAHWDHPGPSPGSEPQAHSLPDGWICLSALKVSWTSWFMERISTEDLETMKGLEGKVAMKRLRAAERGLEWVSWVLVSCLPLAPVSWMTLGIYTYIYMKVTQSCPVLYDPMDSIVHGILEARILEWVAFPFSRGSSQTRDWTQVSCIAGGFFTSWVTREAQEYWNG